MMGLELAKCFIRIQADSSELGAGLDQAKGQTESAMSSIQTTASGITTALGMMAGAFLRLGIQSSMSFEQTKIAFDTMLGSADETKRTLADLTDFAAKTPFEMPEILGAARGLIQFGERGEQLMDTLKMLGDAAAGTSQPFGEVALIFNQVRGAGRLMGQDLMQLSQRGILTLKDLGDYLGKSVREVDAMKSKGEISFDIMRGALAKLSQEGGRYYNLMEKQSTSLGGLVSTLKDGYNILAQTMAGPVAEAMKPIITMAIKLTDVMGTLVQRFPQAAAGALLVASALGIMSSGVLAVTIASRLLGVSLRTAFITTGIVGAVMVLAIGIGALTGYLTDANLVTSNVVQTLTKVVAGLAGFYLGMKLVTIATTIYTAVTKAAITAGIFFKAVLGGPASWITLAAGIVAAAGAIAAVEVAYNKATRSTTQNASATATVTEAQKAMSLVMKQTKEVADGTAQSMDKLSKTMTGFGATVASMSSGFGDISERVSALSKESMALVEIFKTAGKEPMAMLDSLERVEAHKAKLLEMRDVLEKLTSSVGFSPVAAKGIAWIDASVASIEQMNLILPSVAKHSSQFAQVQGQAQEIADKYSDTLKQQAGIFDQLKSAVDGLGTSAESEAMAMQGIVSAAKGQVTALEGAFAAFSAMGKMVWFRQAEQFGREQIDQLIHLRSQAHMFADDQTAVGDAARETIVVLDALLGASERYRYDLGQQGSLLSSAEVQQQNLADSTAALKDAFAGASPVMDHWSKGLQHAIDIVGGAKGLEKLRESLKSPMQIFEEEQVKIGAAAMLGLSPEETLQAAEKAAKDLDTALGGPVAKLVEMQKQADLLRRGLTDAEIEAEEYGKLEGADIGAFRQAQRDIGLGEIFKSINTEMDAAMASLNGMSPEMARLYDLGASMSELNWFAEQEDSLKAIQKELAVVSKEAGERLKQAFTTPVEKSEEQVRILRENFRRGWIEEETYRRGLIAEREKLELDIPKGITTMRSMMDAFTQAQIGMEDMLDPAKTSAEEARKHTTLLDDISKELKKVKPSGLT